MGLTGYVGITGFAEIKSEFQGHVDCAIEYSQGSVHVVISGHDETTTNLVKLMPAHICGAVGRVCVCAHAHAELAVSLSDILILPPHFKSRHLTI